MSRQARRRGCICPNPVAVERAVSRACVGPLIAIQERVDDLPARGTNSGPGGPLLRNRLAPEAAMRIPWPARSSSSSAMRQRGGRWKRLLVCRYRRTALLAIPGTTGREIASKLCSSGFGESRDASHPVCRKLDVTNRATLAGFRRARWRPESRAWCYWRVRSRSTTS